MDKIYARAEDKNVRCYKTYGKSGDSYVYADPEHGRKLTAAEAENLYMKGVIVVIDDKMYTAVGCTESSGVISLLFLTEGSGSTATLLTLKSEG